MLVLTAFETKKVEENAFKKGITGERLMENAGAAATQVIRKNYNLSNKRVVVVTGQGNNGGDGFVIARKLKEYGVNVSVVMSAGITVTPDATKMFKRAKDLQVPMLYYYDNTYLADELLSNADIIVDAIFGTGFHTAPEKDIATIIEKINAAKAHKVALDLPSGVLCDTGAVTKVAVKAELTISFIAYKPCHFIYPATEYVGKVVAVSIGIEPDSTITPFAKVIDENIALNNLSDIPSNAHKYQKGMAFIVAGSYGMAGAAVISAKSAMRSGAGIVKLCLPKSIYPIIASALPEVVFNPLNEIDGFVCSSSFDDEFLNKADALLIGPGLANNEHTTDTVFSLLNYTKIPTVIDADALNIIAKRKEILKQISAPIIVTPHTGEMARLTGKTCEEIEKNRINTALQFSKEYNVITVLKGAYTVIATPNEEVFINTTGNAGMATAGSGDMLSGMIVAFLANKTNALKAVTSAVCLHGVAGERVASRLGIRGMLTTDMIEELPLIFKKRFGVN